MTYLSTTHGSVVRIEMHISRRPVPGGSQVQGPLSKASKASKASMGSKAAKGAENLLWPSSILLA